MKYHYALIAFFVTLACVSGQDPAFDGKIRLRAPARSSWEVILRPAAALRLQKSEQNRTASVLELPLTPPKGEEALVQLKVEKSKNLFHEMSLFSTGRKAEKWSMGTLQLSVQEGSDDLVIAGSSLLDEGFTDRSTQDFEELEWVTKDDYKGTILFGEMPCFLFQVSNGKKPISRRDAALQEFLDDAATSTEASEPEATSPPAGTSASAAPAEPAASAATSTAIISADTRLPVLYSDGEVLRIYRIDTNSSGALVPPEKFVREFEARRKHFAERNRRPGSR